MQTSDHISITPTLFAANDSEKKRKFDALLEQRLQEIGGPQLSKFRKNFGQKIKAATRDAMLKKKPLPTQNAIRFGLVNAIKSLHSAHCSDLALYAMVKLIKNGYPGSIEFVSFKNYDHQFLVLNRPKDSDPQDWRTWGKEAIILDPWLNVVTDASQLGKLWQDKTNLITTGNIAEQVERTAHMEAEFNAKWSDSAPEKVSFEKDIKPKLKESLQQLAQQPLDHPFETIIEMDDKAFREISTYKSR